MIILGSLRHIPLFDIKYTSINQKPLPLVWFVKVIVNSYLLHERYELSPMHGRLYHHNMSFHVY